MINSSKIQHPFKYLLKFFISLYMPSNNCRRQNSKEKLKSNMLLTWPVREKYECIRKVGVKIFFQTKMKERGTDFSSFGSLYNIYQLIIRNRSNTFLSFVSSIDAQYTHTYHQGGDGSLNFFLSVWRRGVFLLFSKAACLRTFILWFTLERIKLNFEIQYQILIYK